MKVLSNFMTLILIIDNWSGAATTARVILLLESLWSLFDNLGKRKWLCQELWFVDYPVIWMSQTSFILDKPVLLGHTHTYSGVLLSFCAPATLHDKTNGILGIFGLVLSTPWPWVRHPLYIFSGPRLAYKKCGGDRVNTLCTCCKTDGAPFEIFGKKAIVSVNYKCDIDRFTAELARVTEQCLLMCELFPHRISMEYTWKACEPFSCEILTYDGHRKSE